MDWNTAAPKCALEFMSTITYADNVRPMRSTVLRQNNISWVSVGFLADDISLYVYSTVAIQSTDLTDSIVFLLSPSRTPTFIH